VLGNHAQAADAVPRPLVHPDLDAHSFQLDGSHVSCIRISATVCAAPRFLAAEGSITRVLDQSWADAEAFAARFCSEQAIHTFTTDWQQPLFKAQLHSWPTPSVSKLIRKEIHTVLRCVPADQAP
jgi:hypothetical protein